MVYLDANGHQRYTKGVDEKLVARQRRGAAPGKAMYIEGGRHSGFFCTVRPLMSASDHGVRPSPCGILAAHNNHCNRVRHNSGFCCRARATNSLPVVNCSHAGVSRAHRTQSICGGRS